MRILTIARTNTPHGVRPVASLLHQGHEVMLLDDSDPFPEGRPGYTFVPMRLDSPSIVAIIQRAGRAFRPDIVHVHWVDHRATAAILAEVGPVVLSVWGTDLNQWFVTTPQGPQCQAPDWFRATIAHAAHIIVDDATMPAKCAAAAGGPVPCSILHLGIDETLYESPLLDGQASQLRNAFGIPSDGFVFLSPRAFSERYRHHAILKAFSGLVAQENVWLVFKTFYNNPPYDPMEYEVAIRALADRLQCAHRLRWIDAMGKDDLPALYAACDAIVNFPIMDGFPVTFLEAMAAQRLIVSCQLEAYHGSIVESAGIFCENSVGALRSAMRHACSLKGNPQHVRRLERVGEQVRREYSQSRYASGLLNIYASLLKVGSDSKVTSPALA